MPECQSMRSRLRVKTARATSKRLARDRISTDHLSRLGAGAVFCCCTAASGELTVWLAYTFDTDAAEAGTHDGAEPRQAGYLAKPLVMELYSGPAMDSGLSLPSATDAAESCSYTMPCRAARESLTAARLGHTGGVRS